MNRIAFIDTCFTGSILPLAKQYIDHGWQVDLYELCSDRINKKLEAMTFEEIDCPHGVGDIPQFHWKHLQSYLPPDKFRFRYISTSRPFKAVPVLKDVMRLYRGRQIRRAMQIINEENYDVVNIVALYWQMDFIPIIRQLKGKVIFSVHEVCNHNAPDFSFTPPLLAEVFARKLPIVVFSDNSYRDIVRYRDADKRKIHVIPFGRFETYRYMVRSSALQVGTNYHLFIGVLKPYKGLDLFAKAIDIIRKKRPEIRFVVAGAGYDESLKTLQGKDNVKVINRFIDNDEFAYLLANAHSVACPYKTASQSGIPQTSFVFGKPVIATNIGSFHEILGEGKMGILTEPDSAESFANAILRMEDDKVYYAEMVENIAHFNDIMPEYDWKNIYGMYEGLTE